MFSSLPLEVTHQPSSKVPGFQGSGLGFRVTCFGVLRFRVQGYSHEIRNMGYVEGLFFTRVLNMAGSPFASRW